MTHEENRVSCVEALQQAGYKALLVDSIIESASDGYIFLIGINRPHWVQFMVTITNQDKRYAVGLEFVNQFNTNYRIFKCFIDNDGDVGMIVDFFTPVEHYNEASFAEQLRSWLMTWSSGLGLLQRDMWNARPEKSSELLSATAENEAFEAKLGS